MVARWSPCRAVRLARSAMPALISKNPGMELGVWLRDGVLDKHRQGPRSNPIYSTRTKKAARLGGLSPSSPRKGHDSLTWTMGTGSILFETENYNCGGGAHVFEDIRRGHSVSESETGSHSTQSSPVWLDWPISRHPPPCYTPPPQ